MRRASCLRRAGWLCLVAGLLVGLVFLAPTPPKSPMTELPRDALVLREGRLYVQGQSAPFTGVMVEHYENAGLKSRSSISNGLLEGLSEGWHTNGQKQIQESFHLGASEGLRTKWYSTGQRLSTAMIHDGKLDGTFRRWNEDGSISEEIEMRQGNPHGLSRAYFPSGFIRAEVRLSDGRMLEQHFWKDGERRATGLN